MTTGDPLLDKYITGWAIGSFFGVYLGWSMAISRHHTSD